jgi:hypothetical protein
MRYFFVSYAHPEGFGNLCITGNQFPAQQYIREQVSQQMNTNQIIVISIYEFRNREDYEAFQAAD